MHRSIRPFLSSLSIASLVAGSAAAQLTAQPIPSQASGVASSASQPGSLRHPLLRVAKRTEEELPTQPLVPEAEHKLMPAVRMARNALVNIDNNIADYSCVFVKRERIDGELGKHEFMSMKVRHKPFSVYMNFLGPKAVKGREVLYVQGRNDGKLVAHEGAGLLARKNFWLDPNGFLAMRGQRYPITKTGIRNLTAELIEVAEEDMKFDDSDVKFFQGAKIDGRPCTCLEVVHPERRPGVRYHRARVFIDDELRIPVRFESFDFPTRAEPKMLLEEYTYTNLKLNEGFTDEDFDFQNPAYRFN